MTFEVRLSERASKDLAALPRKVQVRVVDKLTRAREDPVRFFRPLSGSQTLRLRVGDHRILAEIDHAAKEIRIHTIGHRRNVYK